MNRKRPILAKTIRSLARHVGRSDHAVRKWFNHRAWWFPKTGPWNVDEIKDWMEKYLKGDASEVYRKSNKAVEEGRGEFAGMSELTKRRTLKLGEQILTIRQDRMIKAGEMHNRKECDGRRASQVKILQVKLLDLPRLVRAFDATGELERLLDSRIREMIKDFAGDPGQQEPTPEAPEETNGQAV